MLSAEAQVETGRASRYLRQLCEHLNQIGHHHTHGGAHPSVERVEWSDQQGVITFAQGRCTLRATAHTLTLRAEAVDADGLLLMKDMLAARLETIGRRDRLMVMW